MRADRLVATLLLLQSRKRVTAADVAAELEVSVRTARRDLEALSAAGIPVFPQAGRGGGWELVGGARTDLSGLTADEARTLFMVAGPEAAATPELKAICPDEEKFRVVDERSRELKQRYETVDIDGARVNFPHGAWGLVRASNTNPYLTLRFEARSAPEIDAMKRLIYDALRRYPFVTLPD